MTRPSIGVVVATRDGAPYLGEQLRSIINGSTVPDHVLVSDDDSRDETVAIAEELLAASGIPYEIVRNSPPLGVARNVAAAIARRDEDIVVLADQDDRWHGDRLERAVRHFSDPAVVLSHGDADLVDARGSSIGATLLGRLEVSAVDRMAVNEGHAFETYLRRNLATGATMAVRRSAVADALDIPETWIHDEWFAAVASTRGRVVLDERPLIDYRLHGANQIGVRAPTFAHKVRQVLGADGARNVQLARRFEALAEFLERHDSPAATVRLAREKARFEKDRAELPRVRLLRVPGVLRAARGGRYRRFASRGRLDIVRDLLQPR